MIYPQTFAQDVTRNIEAIGKYGCLAMCYIYCMGIDPSKESYVQIVSDAMYEKLLDNECTVLDAAKFLSWLTGKRYNVQKKQIDDLKKIKEPTPIKYSYNGRSHWVVVQAGKIVFNSLINSQCVTKGSPAKDLNARVITLGR